MRGQVIIFIFRRIGALFANFCVKMKKKSKKSLEGTKKSLSLQPVSEITGKFIDNIERLVQQVPRTKMRALILFFRKDE